MSWVVPHTLLNGTEWYEETQYTREFLKQVNRACSFLRDLVWQMEGRKEGAPLEELVIEDPMKVSAMEQCKADTERLREVAKVVRFE